MTTPDDPAGSVPDADPLDELASALVDGEATDAERTRAGDPAVSERVAAFERVAGIVATPVPAPSDAHREAAIAAAVAAIADAAAPVGRVVPMRRRTGAPRWLPAAAAVAVVVAGLGLLVAALGSVDGDGDEAATDSASEEAGGEPTDTFQQSVEAGAPASTVGDAGGSGGSTATGSAAPPVPAVDLGELGDVDDLEAALRNQAPPTAGAAAAGGEAENEGEGEDDSAARVSPPCADVFGPALVHVFTARLDGEPVTVGLFDEPDGRRTYAVVDQDTCEAVDGGEL